MVHCKRCGAENYAIDMWCSRCQQHLDWASPAAEPALAEPTLAESVAAAPVAPASPLVEPEGSRPRLRATVWLLPAGAAAVLAVLLALPVAGWFTAASHQAATPQLPLTAGISQASPASTPTPSPTVTPSPTPTPTPQADQALVAPPPADQPVPVPAFQTLVGEPTTRVAGFYQAVAAHQFDAAAAAWSVRMQANYPPSEFIDRRFAYTQQMNLRAAHVLANNGQVATVYIDLIEVYAGTTRHWVGTWQLVSSSSGWLLNQPNLRAG